MKLICNKEKCFGCRVCEKSCPKKAIKMIEDEKGFLYPEIDEKICNNCGICKKVCPSLDKMPDLVPLKIYACKNKDAEKRNSSSSGGVFQEIANLVLQMNGSIYGASFNNENKVVHIRGNSIDDLEKIKKSKYVQSDMEYVFDCINQDIKQDKYVLFSGTPCQVQAIKNYKNLTNTKILTVDIVCHGVPSPKIFEDYKKYLEKIYNSKIVSINFRHKNEKSTQNIKVDFENGQSYISNFSEGDIFYSLFLKNIILRDSCYDCKYKNFNRISDITLGDFWGYQNGSAKEFGDKKGISLVLINTKKGMDIFDKIKNNIEFFEISKEECYPYNCFFNFEVPKEYNEIWKEYMEKGFESIINNTKS